MIILGPFALLCLMLLFFRPVRLLAGSLFVSLLVIAIRLGGEAPDEHINVLMTFVITQLLYWWIMTRSSSPH